MLRPTSDPAIQTKRRGKRRLKRRKFCNDPVDSVGTSEEPPVYCLSISPIVVALIRRRCMRLSLSSWWGTLLGLLLFAACSPIRQTAAPTTTTGAGSAIPSARHGPVKVEAVTNAGISGTFTARDNGDGTTLLEIKLDNASDFNPWGIYPLLDCASGVPVDRRPLFALPDIEVEPPFRCSVLADQLRPTIPGRRIRSL